MYRELAPIPAKAWQEIDNRSREVFLSVLSARKTLRVNGPNGPEYTAYNFGRLSKPAVKDRVGYATYQLAPLVETRVEFRLPRWELDNALRGDRQIDFAPLEEAVRDIALFEENAVYHGLKSAAVTGLLEAAKAKLALGKDAASIKAAVAAGVLKLKKAFAQGVFDLVVSESLYAKLWSIDSPTPLVTEVLALIGGRLIVSEVMEGALLLPHDNENLSLILGEDFTLGYQGHDDKTVTFYLKESFTFQVLDDSLIVRFV